MRITIASGEKAIDIRLPSRLLFNSVTAAIAGPAIVAQSMKNCGGPEVELDRRTVRALFREINRCRRRFPDWCLVEAESGGKTQLRIRL
ncbi:MAG: hypothetical protein ACI4OU_04510 [Candidatus Enterenecus sp.]